MISLLRTLFFLIAIATLPLIATAQSTTFPPAIASLSPSENESDGGGGAAVLASRRTATATACDNSPALCDRSSYANITHIGGAHGSSFLRGASTNDSIAGNQHFNATSALDAGLRLLQVQAHHQSTGDDNGATVLELCRTACWLLGAGPPSDWLALLIRAWMDDHHPDEVATLLIVNPDGASAADLGAVFFEDAGIDGYGYGYAPSSTSTGTTTTTTEWPTLREMTTAGTRLVTFFVAPLTADTAAHPYLLSESDHVFETACEVTAPSSESAAFNCTVDRPSTFPSGSVAIDDAGLLPLVNRFAYRQLLAADVLIPDEGGVAAVNSPSESGVGALGRHARLCREEWGGGVTPTFVLVDFWEQGPSIDAADAMNGVVTPVGRVNSTVAASVADDDDDDDGGSTGEDSGNGAGEAGAGGSTGSKVSDAGTGALVAFIVGALLLVR